MSVARVFRWGVLSVALATVALTSGASQATRQEAEPVIRPPAVSPLGGRIAPDEAGYGRFEETITVQDV